MAARGNTTVRYGDVIIQVNTTDGWSMEPVPEPSGTDVIYSRYSITVSGILDRGPGAGRFFVTPFENDATATHKRIRNTLQSRRQEFMYHDVNHEAGQERQAGADTLVHAKPAFSNKAGGPPKIDANTDVNNGPFCEDFSIDRVANDIFHIKARFVCHLIPCSETTSASDAGRTPLGGVLSNRWEVNETADKNGFLTRAISGRLRFASVNLPPNAFANLAFPSLADGFLRESTVTNLSATGLEMGYIITDRQVVAAAPAPARTWSARVTEDLNNEMKIVTGVSVTLEGAPDVNKQQLFQAAAKFVLRRLGVGSGGQRFMGLRYTDYVTEAKVEMSAQVLQHAGIDEAVGSQSFLALPAAKFLNLTQENVGAALLFPGAFLAGKALGVDAATVKTLAEDAKRAQKKRTGGALARFRERLGLAGFPPGPAEFGKGYNRFKNPTPAAYPKGSAAESFIAFLQTPCGAVNRLKGKAVNEQNAGHALRDNRSKPAAAPDTQKTHQTNIQRLQSNQPVFSPPPAAPALSQGSVTFYAHSKVEARTYRKPNAIQLPICKDSGGNDADTVVVTVARPSTRFVVKLAASRIGGPPFLLRHEVFDDPIMGIMTPIGEAKIFVGAPVLQSDQQREFTVFAEYEWAATKSPKPGESLRGASLPWDTTTPDQNRIGGAVQAVPGSAGAIA